MEAPLGPGEQREPDEDAHIAEMERVLRAQMEQDYPQGATQRDAHPKTVALLEGRFTIAADLPAELRVGLFAGPASYRAWVRVSNASRTPQSDAIPDLRGLAIKLLDVPGAKIPESDEADTQDFLLLSTPSMPLGTVKLFRDAIVYTLRRSRLLFALKLVFTGQGRVLRALGAARSRPGSPLALRYWSTTPYQYGERAAKYTLIPAASLGAEQPAAAGNDGLSEAMERTLAAGPVSFDFAVQLRAEGMPLEDAAVPWDEAGAPFRTVATLTLPPQAVRSEERLRQAEMLSFSPAHARLEHRPLGGLNRARMRIYRALSDFRHTRDGRGRLP